MLSILQIQDRLNDSLGRITVLELALLSDRVSDLLDENEVDGFVALLSDVAESLETAVSELAAYKKLYTPEEKEKFRKAVRTINQLQSAIDPKIAVN